VVDRFERLFSVEIRHIVRKQDSGDLRDALQQGAAAGSGYCISLARGARCSLASNSYSHLECAQAEVSICCKAAKQGCGGRGLLDEPLKAMLMPVADELFVWLTGSVCSRLAVSIAHHPGIDKLLPTPVWAPARYIHHCPITRFTPVYHYACRSSVTTYAKLDD
jgi:hypothetical protein